MEFSFRSNSNDPTLFRRRVGYAVILVFCCFSLLFLRLFYLQLIKQTDYSAAAESNRTVVIPSVSSRGLIRDRNGEMLAQNYWAYSLEIIPNKIGKKPLNQLIGELSEIIAITPSEIKRFHRLRQEVRRFESVLLKSRLTDEEVAHFVAQKWRFPGVNIRSQEFREYPQKSTASHLIGYIGRISRRDIQYIEEEGASTEYQGFRTIGKVGIERSYEAILHGKPGHEMLEVTAGGRPIRRLSIEDPSPGKNLELCIDLNLQRVAENALNQEPGAAIAIDPKTGEVLAFVSTPTYNPNLFPGGIDPDSWEELSLSESKPMLNRAARGLYPIGSTYKPFIALAGLENGVIDQETVINDTGVFVYFNHRFRDSSRSAKGLVNLNRSLAISSDVYYYWLATELGINRLYPFMQQWGFGQKTGIDIIGEQSGTLPNPEWKERRFKKSWVPGDTVNLGIGQGYNQFTLLQLAHATATLANRGVVMRPHIVRKIIDPKTGMVEEPNRDPVRTIPLKTENLDAVIAGMIDVTRVGTAKKIFQNIPYKVAGKTGTAQVITIAQDKTYDAKKLSRQHHDHALFIAFAPADNPKIAVAVLKENGGFGAQAAAPVARAMLDYWILGRNDLGLPPPNWLSGKEQILPDFPIPQKDRADGKGADR